MFRAFKIAEVLKSDGNQRTRRRGPRSRKITCKCYTHKRNTHTHTHGRIRASVVFPAAANPAQESACGASCIFDLIGRLESGVGSERGRERPRRLCSERAESRAEISSLNFRHKSASLESREVLFRRSRASPRVTDAAANNLDGASQAAGRRRWRATAAQPGAAPFLSEASLERRACGGGSLTLEKEHLARETVILTDA